MKRILITGGPTNEYIDEVMKITNMSTGSLSLDLAKCAADAACEVTLIVTESVLGTARYERYALKKDPKSVKIGGTSAAGSMDHVQFLIIARAAGVKNLNKIDYVAFDSDGATQVLGGHIDLFSTSLADVMGLVQSGDLRVLAQTADKRIGTGKQAEIPTCIESGINATFQNWRGLFGCPDMPDYAVAYWNETLAKLVKTPEWKAALAKYGWDDVYLNGTDFTKFLEKTESDYKVILQEIGMI